MPSVKRVRTEWTGLPGGPALTTNYWPDSVSVANCIAGTQGFWDAMKARIANDAAWTVLADVETVDVTTGQVTSVASGTAGTGVGTASDAMLSLGTQGLLNLRTGTYVNGREVRGKLYVPVPTVGQNNDGVPIAAYKTALGASYAAALAAGPATAMMIYSPTNHAAYPVTATSPSAYWARLRSRQR